MILSFGVIAILRYKRFKCQCKCIRSNNNELLTNQKRVTTRGETFYSLFGRQTVGSVTVQISCPINRNLAGDDPRRDVL